MKVFFDIFRLLEFLLKCSRTIKRSRISILLIILTGVLGGVSATALITLVNRALSGNGSSPSIVIWGFILLLIVSPVMRFTSQVLLLRLSARSIFELRTQLCRRILSAPLRRLEELGSHRLLATLTEDIPLIIGALIALPMLCVDTAVVIGCLFYLGRLSWQLLSGVVVIMAFGIAIYQIALVRALRYFKLARDGADLQFRQYVALADGAKELKLHRKRRNAFQSWLETTTLKLQEYSIIGSTITAAAANWSEILFFIFIGLMLFFLPGRLDLSAGTMTAYVLTTLYMRTPLAQVMNVLPGLGRANVSVKKVEELGFSLLAHPQEWDSVSESDPQPSWESLELSEITHSYRRDGEEQDFTLGPINLALHPGEVVFLVGGNGSGKTTLAKLITGLYAPDSGEIRLDGELITKQNRDDYRQRFSAIFSDFYLFESFFGFEDSSINVTATEYLVKLQLEHKVKIKDGALSSIDLSQGQRKRLALLTAYLEDRLIYLFDEWAADQDPFFKEVFYYQLLPELKARGKTAIVISHDDRYFKVADRIIKLDYGKLEFDRQAAHSWAPSPGGKAQVTR